MHSNSASYQRLMGEERARCVFTDPPYNVRVTGHVCRSGRVQHREFLCASGELSEGEFTAFLGQVLCCLADAVVDGGLIYGCMDFRHINEMIGRRCCSEAFAAQSVYLEQNEWRYGVILSV